MNMCSSFEFYEFFAGGGMARLGLGEGWACAFANEWCERKASSYRLNFSGADELCVTDIAELTHGNLSGKADLAWASFPCQDLSLAGKRAGLAGQRSGTFHAFHRLIVELQAQHRAPSIICLENVPGAITSNEGRDFHALLGLLWEAGYRAGPLVLDAIHFLPQSRPRLFVVAVDRSIPIEGLTTTMSALSPWQKHRLHEAWAKAPKSIQNEWIWWRLPIPPERRQTLADLIEISPQSVSWHTPAETEGLLRMMSARHRDKINEVLRSGDRIVGTVYKRTRVENGKKVQRAEIRLDGVSGCLRTPAGGSSRQIILIIDQGQIRSRLLSTREAARLMGIPESYQLPKLYNEGYHLAGDGVAVPVVAWLEAWLLRPLAVRANSRSELSLELASA